MKREFNPVYVALFLIFGSVLFRLITGQHPEALPGVSPFIAIAFVGGLCLPRRWGWLVGLAAYVLSDLAFLGANRQFTGSMFSWWSVMAVVIYIGMTLLGLVIVQRPSLLKVIGGTLAGSLLFYVAANTFAWWDNVALHELPAYPAGLAGWWQANTIGLVGYEPSWLFLRNSMAGDLGFVLFFLLILDRSLLFGRGSVPAVSRVA